MKITKISEQFGDYLYHRLPKVYRDYDVAIDRRVKTDSGEEIKRFYTLQEYLYSFADGGFKPLLEDLEAIITLIDPMQCPEQFLPIMLQHFGLDFIEDIPVKFQRRLIQNIVTLYKKKGTIPAVAFLARELSGFDVTIEETERGDVEFALVKLNAYENEDAELLLAQEVVQRYIHLFLPTSAKAEIIVTYGFTEGIHINSTIPLEDYLAKDSALTGYEYDHVKYDVEDDDTEHANFVWDEYFFEHSDLIKKCVEEDFALIKSSYETDDSTLEDFDFTPFDTSSLTNMLDEGDFVYTNGTCCEDTILSATYDGEEFVECSVPEGSKARVSKLAGGNVTAKFPVGFVTKPVTKGTTLKFTYSGKTYYWTATKYIGATTYHPTRFILDVANQRLRILSHFRAFKVNQNTVFTQRTGYNSFEIDLNDRIFVGGSEFYLTDGSCSYSGDASYGNNVADGVTVFTTTSRTQYANSETLIHFARGGITSIAEMKKSLAEKPFTLYLPIWQDGCAGNFMEVDLDTETEATATTSVTVALSTNSEDIYYYPMTSLMRSTSVAIEDENGIVRSFKIPIELLSLNGKSDFIEKVDSDTYHVHRMIDRIELRHLVDPKGYADPTLIRFNNYRKDDEPYYPIEPVDLAHNVCCDWCPVTSENLTGVTLGNYDFLSKKFMSVGHIAGWSRTKFMEADVNINIALYTPTVTGTVICQSGRTLNIVVRNATDGTTIFSDTVTSSDGTFKLNITLPSLLRKKRIEVSMVGKNANGRELVNLNAYVSSTTTSIAVGGTVNTATNVVVDAEVKTNGLNLVDKSGSFSGSTTLQEMSIPNLVAIASASLKAVGYETVATSADVTTTPYFSCDINTHNGDFMRKYTGSSYDSVREELRRQNIENWNTFISGSQYTPAIYYVRAFERVEKITDPEVINKLNLLPIPDKYAKIYSKDIPFSEIEVSAESKMYY